MCVTYGGRDRIIVHGMSHEDADSPSLTVVRTIARREGVSPESLRPPLSTVVDTDALDELIASGDTLTGLEFQYNSYDVVVDGDGGVTVTRSGGYRLENEH